MQRYTAVLHWIFKSPLLMPMPLRDANNAFNARGRWHLGLVTTTDQHCQILFLVTSGTSKEKKKKRTDSSTGAKKKRGCYEDWLVTATMCLGRVKGFGGSVSIWAWPTPGGGGSSLRHRQHCFQAAPRYAAAGCTCTDARNGRGRRS